MKKGQRRKVITTANEQKIEKGAILATENVQRIEKGD